ncbi:uncharacterized protein BT62DRAFT_1075083 [Guyanagaster necrorhizus]|uniref:C2H2-type domain-containing protein n=1 Tax=Guyanagaster necrorhizus TaxID=856835 RepID=A0A9P8ATS6_9AGAR|nr:uncharacterized protein BT62DRAFT_1075083 [Guyanagaster necrorhizus MCA 3950]KAG7447724.1 hypothetical protein BT62DRAFT_1075083 [Guyanagaster necrorhizus MCA 3950]
MVFGIFSRKVQPDNQLKSNPTQLRTPSPSVESSSVGMARLNASPTASLQEPPASPSPPLEGDAAADLGFITDPAALHSLVSSVPPKIFHEYTLTHLIPPTRSPASPSHVPIHPPSSRTLTHLTSFFSTLTPPPRLHCVRCHKFYFDVENTDRSCVVHHDDESAEVSRVGAAKTKGTEYETLWACCGKTVEGDGDMGPPDGWCYEGKHTTDLRRARFRADSSIHDDKLTSCDHLRCHEPPLPPSDTSSPSPSPRARKRSTRKRARPADDDGEGGEVDQPIADDAQSVVSSKGKEKQKAPPSKPRKKRAKTSNDDKAFKPEPVSDYDDMDVDETASTSSKYRKAKPKPKPKPATTRVLFPTARTPSPTRPPAFAVPASPILRKSLSPSRSVVSVVVSAAPRSLKEPMKSRGRPNKPLTDVVSTSVSGEE